MEVLLYTTMSTQTIALKPDGLLQVRNKHLANEFVWFHILCQILDNGSKKHTGYAIVISTVVCLRKTVTKVNVDRLCIQCELDMVTLRVDTEVDNLPNILRIFFLFLV